MTPVDVGTKNHRRPRNGSGSGPSAGSALVCAAQAKTQSGVALVGPVNFGRLVLRRIHEPLTCRLHLDEI